MGNPRCPDHSSHSDNARERLYPSSDSETVFGAEETEAIDREAEAEYRACEGH